MGLFSPSVRTLPFLLLNFVKFQFTSSSKLPWSFSKVVHTSGSILASLPNCRLTASDVPCSCIDKTIYFFLWRKENMDLHLNLVKIKQICVSKKTIVWWKICCSFLCDCIFSVKLTVLLLDIAKVTVLSEYPVWREIKLEFLCTAFQMSGYIRLEHWSVGRDGLQVWPLWEEPRSCPHARQNRLHYDISQRTLWKRYWRI